MLCANKFHCLLLRVLAPSHHKHILSVYMKLLTTLSDREDGLRCEEGIAIAEHLCVKNFLHLVQTNFITYYTQQHLLDIQTECSSIHSFYCTLVPSGYNIQLVTLMVRQIFICNWEFELQYSCVSYWVPCLFQYNACKLNNMDMLVVS